MILSNGGTQVACAQPESERGFVAHEQSTGLEAIGFLCLPPSRNVQGMCCCDGRDAEAVMGISHMF